MKENVRRHLIAAEAPVREALLRLDQLAGDAVLFLQDQTDGVMAALTDGDIRRYLLRGGGVEDAVVNAGFTDFKSVPQGAIDLAAIRRYRNAGLRIVPVLDGERKVQDIINFRIRKSLLPLDAVIMAGGLGTRLRPLTLNTPKPLLKVGGKPIIEHNIDRLRAFGVQNITISINYLGEQLVDYFGDGSAKGLNIRYVNEENPRGTIGAVSDLERIENDNLLVMNSDLLTTIDFEAMFLHHLQHQADMSVATVPYEVKVPYGVIEHAGELVTGLREKPTYTYYSNAGIYVLRSIHQRLIPPMGRFGAPDLMEKLYTNGQRVVHYPIMGYWLDIGKHHDFEKAQEDIVKLSL
ncbi:MAG: nucleotidyltransferase family protein [Bacteroidota bacterium]